MSDKPFNAPRLAGNIAALLAVILGGAFLLDAGLTWIGWRPVATCTLLPIVQLVLGHTAAIVLTFVGVIVWALSQFKSPAGLTLIAAGIVLGVAPGILAAHLGITCG